MMVVFLDIKQDTTEDSEVMFQTMVVKVQLLDADGNGDRWCFN